jgi:hypothetical protein
MCSVRVQRQKIAAAAKLMLRSRGSGGSGGLGGLLYGIRRPLPPLTALLDISTPPEGKEDDLVGKPALLQLACCSEAWSGEKCQLVTWHPEETGPFWVGMAR